MSLQRYEARPTRALYNHGLYGCGLYSYGLYSHGLYGCGLYSYGLYSYGPYSYGLYSYGLNTQMRSCCRSSRPSYLLPPTIPYLRACVRALLCFRRWLGRVRQAPSAPSRRHIIEPSATPKYRYGLYSYGPDTLLKPRPRLNIGMAYTAMAPTHY